MKATLKPWAQKQLSQFGHQINESDLVAAFTSATHECNFTITNVSFIPEDAALSVTAFGKMNDEEEEYFIRVVYPTPKLPRVKDLSELVGATLNTLLKLVIVRFLAATLQLNLSPVRLSIFQLLIKKACQNCLTVVKIFVLSISTVKIVNSNIWR